MLTPVLHKTNRLSVALAPIGILVLSGIMLSHHLAFGSDSPSGDSIVFEPVKNLGIDLNPVSVSELAGKPIKREQYSVEFAKQNLIPAMGGSVVAVESSKKGYPDLYVVVPGGSNHLLHNNQNGTFTDVTDKAGLKGTGLDLAAAFADYDHSDHQSLFVAGVGGVRVYRASPDGSYADVTLKTGITNNPSEVDAGIVLFDADGDGYPDLLVAAYTDLAAVPDRPTFLFPNNFHDGKSRLYHNQHDGTFKDMTEESGLSANPGRTRKILAADFDGDGRIDLLFLRDNKPPALFMNVGKGKFVDKTSDADEDLIIYAFLDGQAVDLNGNGKVDLALWSAMATRVLFNQGEGKFEETKTAVITQPPHAFGFHGLVADLDGDGSPDLLAAEATGSWRLLINHNGRFAATPFVLSSADHLSPGQFAFITPARLHGDERVSLIAVTKEGQLQVFEKKQAAPAPSAPHPAP